jgi:uncharacterized phage-like protein YoqJ
MNNLGRGQSSSSRCRPSLGVLELSHLILFWTFQDVWIVFEDFKILVAFFFSDMTKKWRDHNPMLLCRMAIEIDIIVYYTFIDQTL